ncbi:MAG: bifunctional serine/threonine-protein kinase/formylglycine-generating enzyme family protein [Rhodanobacter sp.]
MNSIAELIAAFQADKLKLLALFDALTARGALPEAEHRAEVELIEHMRDEGSLEPLIAKALLAKLASLQTPAAGAPADVDADVTVVQIASRPQRPVAPLADADATIVQPASRPTSPMPSAPSIAPSIVDEATIVKPTSQPQASHGGQPADGQSTGVTGTQGVTGTSSSSSFNMASWQRVASAEGGDYATVGMLLKGRFLLEREIGRGGMGVVFLARDERKVEARDRDPYVAVKVLNDEFRRHPDSLIALQRESRRSQLLAHDNIVRVFDFDKDGTIVYMTMEYIDGSDLKTVIRERAFNGMSLSEARPLIEGMAWALKRAHAAGVVHSDFKPGNVMVTRDGVPKVFDFGIARAGKHFGDATGEQTVFDAGTLGALTPAYASLEMIRGGEPSPSDDIYALGCVTFELLTGKHPFDKVSAEVALKEGRKPPPVPGITRRQYKTLCDAVAFHSEQRLKSAVELVEGLREVRFRERFQRHMIYGGGALVLIAVGGWGLSHYLHSEHVAQVIARFAIANPKHYANEDQARDALGSLSEDDRKRLILDQGDAIQGFLSSRLDNYWNPAQGRYDYAKAQHVFQLRDQLKLYSPALDIKRSAMEQQKNDLLNTLDTQLTQRIGAGAIFENQPDNVVTTLATIRAIDPNSALLKNAELELKYDIAIGQSLSANHVDEAKTQLALASRLFPDSDRLKQRASQLAALTQSVAVQAPTGQAAQSVPEARKTLAALIAKPMLTADWQSAVTNAMNVLDSDTSPDTHHLVDSLGNTIADTVAGQASQQTDPLHVQQASSLVALGLQYAPQSAKLIAQRTRLDTLQQQLQAQLDQESAAAEVASRIESMKSAAAANDVAKAQESLDRIRTLQPDNPFLTKDGPQLLANAYLGQAGHAFQHGNYQNASDELVRGLKALGDRPDLRNAKARYDWVATVMKARGQSLASTDLDRMKKQLSDLRKADADGLGQLEADMKLHGQLPDGTLASLLDSLKTSTATAANPATNAPASAAVNTPGNTAAPATQPSSGAVTQPATTKSPAGSTAAATKPAAGAAVANTAVANATATNGATSADPCARPELIGKGKPCFDALGARRGPSLVVVPGIGGGKPYAISRTEITVGEFNRFCSATGQCSASGGGDPDAGSLPISNISLAQAKAYASWLSTSSGGYVYRLPTDAEWMHAAEAGSGWKQASDSNCVPPSAAGNDNTGAPISALGREANPWGLVNMTGNVWEWVTSGGGVMVRGGSYNSYWSDCTVASHRDDSGSPQKDVGFRILRELK